MSLNKKSNFILSIFVMAILLFSASGIQAAQKSPTSNRDLKFTGEFMTLMGSNSNGLGFGFQLTWLPWDYIGIAPIIGGGSEIFSGSSAFFYGAKTYLTFFSMKKNSVFPYIGYGIAKANIGNNSSYSIPAYSSDISFPFIGVEGQLLMFNAHYEIGAATIVERGYTKNATLISLAFGFNF